MKKFMKLITIVFVFTFVFAGLGLSAQAKAKVKFHIGVVTGSGSQSEDDLRGAKILLKEYGTVKSGGIFQHVMYPDDFMSLRDTYISSVVALADDPLMKAIVVNQAIPGTSEAFKRIRVKRPDILLLAGEPHEDPLVIQSSADLVLSADFVSRGYTIVWAAKQLGAKNFVHISFSRHMKNESFGRRRAIMEAASKDLGLRFVFETVPDPISDVGVPGAQQYILEKVPQWIEKYGKDTAFFCTSDVHLAPLLRQLLAHGGIFVEANLPSPLIGYPEVLELDFSKDNGNFPAILKRVEDAIKAKGGAGRFGTWAFPHGFSLSAGLGEFAKMVADGKAKKDNLNDVFKALAKFTPGAKWNGIYYKDMDTGIRAKNQVLIYMDTYVFGKGFLPTTKQKVQDKYFNITVKN
ncbi:MAG: hypothetical protein FD137_222 [Spirochaetes bacterium]|nr:MAG: hypothetical protein FD137_222 [Spirochaetota bacterium]